MKRSVLFWLLLVAALCVIEAKVYVVSVGISDYPGTRNDLRVSANDAKTIVDIYQKNGNAQVCLLTNEQATRANVVEQVKRLFANATAADQVLVYFSGHGTPGALVCYDSLLPYKQIVEKLMACSASGKIVIADACFAGRMRSSNKRGEKYDSQDVMFFLSSRSSETSRETGFSNSMFTIFLERGLRGGADADKNRIITARELYDFVHQGVIEATNGQQHPVMWGNFRDDMEIIKW